jgi:hydroxymethylglutaryl-CoA reductase
MSESKQTAVEWLEERMPTVFKNLTINKHLFEQAKEIEKQQIIDAYSDGAKGGANGGKGQHKDGWVSVQMKEKYYKQTFKKITQ